MATARPFYTPAEEAEVYAKPRSEAQLRKSGALPPLTEAEKAQRKQNDADRRELLRLQAEEDAGDRPKPKPKSRPAGRSGSRLPAPARRIAGDGAGFVLGLLAWGWIVLPYLNPGNKPELGGVRGVKNVWRAKFLNRGPAGEELP